MSMRRWTTGLAMALTLVLAGTASGALLTIEKQDGSVLRIPGEDIVTMRYEVQRVTTTAAVPELSRWESLMAQYGQQHCKTLRDTSKEFNARFEAVYYDAARIAYQIADYLQAKGQDPAEWRACAEAAVLVYRDGYLKPNQYKAAGWMIFPHGLVEHHRRTQDAASKEALIGMATAAAYANEYPLSWTAGIDRSREVAYNLMAKLYARDLGGTPARIPELTEQALGHVREWTQILDGTIAQPTEKQYVRPFMVGLTAEALIEADRRSKDGRALAALKPLLELMWEKLWVPDARAFRYTDRQLNHGGTDPKPDLDGLIAPAYAWVYAQTGETVWRDRADQIFAGSATGAWLAGAKQFNQSYRWTFDYLKWREGKR
ncbi:hypothetical protein [Candidatus Nitrospira bockiana]